MQIIETIFNFLLTLLVLDILVVVHEGCHFLVGKLCKITILEFSVGMGPKIISKVSKKSNIRYSLRAIPFGGYVMFDSENAESKNPNAFTNKSVWARLLTVLAGPVSNIVFGFILTLVLVIVSVPASTTVAQFTDNSVSSSALLQDDKIIAVANVRVHTGAELSYEIMYQGYQPIDITVERNGEKIVVEDVSFPVIEEDEVKFGDMDFKVYAMEKTFINVITQTFYRAISEEKMILDSVADLIRGRFGIESLSSPVGLSSTVGQAVKNGPVVVIYLISLLSMNLGIFNLFPIPALDGGRILFLMCEIITRKKLDPKIENYINTAGIIILFGLMILLVFKDIFAFF